jgi:predicted nucleotidyltransferase component of viral defense system
VIPGREVLDLRSEWQIDVGVIEKDYILGWLLAGIANEPALRPTWIFKGGTCLRKCYYETFRFSEDLDFTVADGGPEDPAELTRIFARVAAWVYDASGVELVLDDASFQQRRNLRGKPTVLGRVSYRGPKTPNQLPKLKLDITSDELLVDRPISRVIGHQYSDTPLPGTGILCYSLVELFAEKLRALAQRCRPRDLYDVVHMHRHPDAQGEAGSVLRILERKCGFVDIATPDIDQMMASPYREEVEQEWENMLGHQLPKPAPPFDEFWNTLPVVFDWLTSRRPLVPLQRIERDDLDPTWTAPRAITSWRRGFPLELVRYAGANRLKVELNYTAERGRSGPRVVEPYSLRRTRDGNLLLFVINDRGMLRGYRVDRIVGVRPTTQTFQAKMLVEF